MLSIYYGNDLVKARAAALNAVDDLVGKFEARLNKIECERYASGMLSDMLGATSLFGGVEVYLIDTPSEDEDFYKAVLSVVKEMSESTNHFIIIENSLLAPERKKFEKCTADVFEYKREAKVAFNTFSMADALARRDKKSLWVLLQEAKRSGSSAEELIGILWWQLKTLRLAKQTKSAAEAGMKDFPYTKAKGALKNFKEGELERLSADLLKVWHDGHGGVREIDGGLEEWVLRG